MTNERMYDVILLKNNVANFIDVFANGIIANAAIKFKVSVSIGK